MYEKLRNKIADLKYPPYNILVTFLFAVLVAGIIQFLFSIFSGYYDSTDTGAIDNAAGDVKAAGEHIDRSLNLSRAGTDGIGRVESGVDSLSGRVAKAKERIDSSEENLDGAAERIRVSIQVNRKCQRLLRASKKGYD